MAPRSAIFDIYDGPNSDLERRPKTPNVSKRMNIKAHSKTDSSRTGEETKTVQKTCPRKKPKQSVKQNANDKVKGVELVEPRRSARLKDKRQKFLGTGGV